MTEFKPFPKVPRYSREIIVTEKIDGTNASIHITPEKFEPWEDELGEMMVEDKWRVKVGSRNQFITPERDNFGFWHWVNDNVVELCEGLGLGSHFGEWWGQGIQRNYGLKEKRFSLFNVSRWATNWRPISDSESEYVTNSARRPLLENDKQEYAPMCCDVVPVITRGMMGDHSVACMDDPVIKAMHRLETCGSQAAPGFMKPEGIVIYHTAANHVYKKTLIGDEHGKGT